jgi:TAG lipase/steryl ester hydrolase/phospholipase A2/LPA acyltransferase
MAESQDEWMDLAEQIDSIQENDIWRTEKTCALYESERIQSRIDELVRHVDFYVVSSKFFCN